MKNKSVIISSVCVTALALCSPLTVSAKEKKSEASPAASASPTATAAAAASTRAIPFHGTIASVDQSAKTFTVGSRVFKVTDKTTVMKEGNPATVTDITEGEQVRGSYWKSADGSLEAKTVKLGPKTEKESKKKAKTEEGASASPSATP